MLVLLCAELAMSSRGRVARLGRLAMNTDLWPAPQTKLAAEFQAAVGLQLTRVKGA